MCISSFLKTLGLDTAVSISDQLKYCPIKTWFDLTYCQGILQYLVRALCVYGGCISMDMYLQCASNYITTVHLCSMEICETAVVHWLKWLLEKLPEFNRLELIYIFSE